VSTGPQRGPAAVGAVAHVFVADLDDRCEITGADGHHLQRVRRLGRGEIVTAADDSGAWRVYTVADAGPGVLALVARGSVHESLAEGIGVSVAVALTKSGLDDVVAATTALGVQRITPVRTERGVVRWDAARAAKGAARLRVVAREAAMQSQRERIPAVDDVSDLAALRDRPGLVIASLDGVPASQLPGPAEGAISAGWTVLVGPEGGLSPEEMSAFAGIPLLRLARNVLRAVHAPIAAVAVLLQEAERRA
jgi:16S rRNA (uracil1498-N3)-methyltransferase